MDSSGAKGDEAKKNLILSLPSKITHIRSSDQARSRFRSKAGLHNSCMVHRGIMCTQMEAGRRFWTFYE